MKPVNSLEVKPLFQKAVPSLPMKDMEQTKKFYIENLYFTLIGEYDKEYLILRKDHAEIHFFLHKDLNTKENYGMCYLKVDGIDEIYENIMKTNARMSVLGQLELKSWGQKEFSIIDNNRNLLTFGQHV